LPTTITRTKALELLVGRSKKTKLINLSNQELEELLRVISDAGFEVIGD